MVRHSRVRAELLDNAAMLEDKGMLVEAAQMYQRALSKEPQHMQLRHYLNQLNNRINQQAVAHKAAERQQEYQQHLEYLFLHLPSSSCSSCKSRWKHNGPCGSKCRIVSMNWSGRRVKSVAFRVVAAARAQAAVAKHDDHVRRGNLVLARRQELLVEIAVQQAHRAAEHEEVGLHRAPCIAVAHLRFALSIDHATAMPHPRLTSPGLVEAQRVEKVAAAAADAIAMGQSVSQLSPACEIIMCTIVCTPCFEVRSRKSRTPRGGGRPSSLTADGLS
ncbi:hypothetical protein QJQ45_029331, partial [Haematococcus lacustris]